MIFLSSSEAERFHEKMSSKCCHCERLILIILSRFSILDVFFLLKWERNEIQNKLYKWRERPTMLVEWTSDEMNGILFYFLLEIYFFLFFSDDDRWWRWSRNRISSQLLSFSERRFSTGKLMDQFIFHFTPRFNLTDEFYCLSHRRQITMEIFIFFICF